MYSGETSADRADNQRQTRYEIRDGHLRFAVAQFAISLAANVEKPLQDRSLVNRMAAQGDTVADFTEVLAAAERDRLPEAMAFVAAIRAAWQADVANAMERLRGL